MRPGDMFNLDELVASALRAGPADGGGEPAILLPAPGFVERPLATFLGLERTVDAQEMPLVGVYLTASEYLGPFFNGHGEEYRADPLWIDLLSQHPRGDLLCALALLNHATRDPDLADSMRADFVRRSPELGRHLEHALSGRGADKRVYLARGPILRTIRAVLTSATDDAEKLASSRAELGLPPPGSMDLTIVATLMTHIVADAMGRKAVAGEPRVGGLPQSLAMELVQNTLFHQAGDVGDSLARTRLLWHGMDPSELQPPPREAPSILLEEATGVAYDGLVATAFALWAKVQEYAPDHGLLLPPETLPAELQPHLAAALSVLAATPDELADAARGQTHDWQMLPLQEHPVVRLPAGLLVLDETYLIERVTTGLFWLVHDREKNAHGEPAAHRWRGNHGQLFEQLAKRRLLPLAPPALLGASTFFDEDDLRRVFPGAGRKHCDTGIDFGHTVVLAEIVSGQVSVPTRTTGDLTTFEGDLERLVFKKTRQLHDTAMRLLSDENSGTTGLLGHVPDKIHPVIVQAGQFPHSRITNGLIDEHLGEHALLADPRIQPLAVVSLEDLELVDVLRLRDGASFPDLLDGWRASEYRDTSLRNYLIERFGLHGGIKRPPSVQAELDPQLQAITTLLGTTMPDAET